MRWLLPRLPTLTKLPPRIELSIIVDQARRSPVATGADLNIRMGARPSDDMAATPLMAERIFPVMAPSFWEEQGRPSVIDRLADLPLLHDRDPSASWAVWRKQFGPERLDIRRGPRLTSSDLILRAAEQGQGVALARERLAAESLTSGALVRPFRDAALDLGPNYWIIPNPETRNRKSVRLVTQWLLDEAGERGAGGDGAPTDHPVAAKGDRR